VTSGDIIEKNDEEEIKFKRKLKKKHFKKKIEKDRKIESELEPLEYLILKI
jgi:hypothetical protein